MLVEKILILSQSEQIILVSELQREVSNLSGRDLCAVMTWIKEGTETIPDNGAGVICRKIQLLTIAELQSFFINWIQGTFDYHEVCNNPELLWPKVVIGCAVGVSAISLLMILLMKFGG